MFLTPPKQFLFLLSLCFGGLLTDSQCKDFNHSTGCHFAACFGSEPSWISTFSPTWSYFTNTQNYLNLVYLKNVYIYIYIYYIHIPRTLWWPLCCLEFWPCFQGLTFKNRGHLGSRYIYIYVYIYTYPYSHQSGKSDPHHPNLWKKTSMESMGGICHSWLHTENHLSTKARQALHGPVHLLGWT